jgi:hypothetical protein
MEFVHGIKRCAEAIWRHCQLDSVRITDSDFRTIGSQTILELLHSAIDQVRKVAALKSVKALPRKKLKEILESYLSSDRMHYYNVIHWLDFGISVQKSRASRAAQDVLTRA